MTIRVTLHVMNTLVIRIDVRLQTAHREHRRCPELLKWRFSIHPKGR